MLWDDWIKDFFKEEHKLQIEHLGSNWNISGKWRWSLFLVAHLLKEVVLSASVVFPGSWFSAHLYFRAPNTLMIKIIICSQTCSSLTILKTEIYLIHIICFQVSKPALTPGSPWAIPQFCGFQRNIFSKVKLMFMQLFKNSDVFQDHLLQYLELGISME